VASTIKEEMNVQNFGRWPWRYETIWNKRYIQEPITLKSG